MKKYFPLAALLLALIAVACSLFPPRPAGDYDLNAFARLPVLADGRLKPFDTIARTALLELQHRQRVVTPDGRELTPTEWLLDVLFRADLADHYQTFRIDSPELLEMFGITEDTRRIEYTNPTAKLMAIMGMLPTMRSRFSFEELSPKLDELQRQATLASQVESAQQSAFERAVLQLQAGLELYQRLKYSLVMPDSPDFMADLLQFRNGLSAGIEAVRAKEAGKPYDKAMAKQIIEAGQAFDFMDKTASLRVIPPDSADAKSDDWQSAGHAPARLVRRWRCQSLRPPLRGDRPRLALPPAG